MPIIENILNHHGLDSEEELHSILEEHVYDSVTSGHCTKCMYSVEPVEHDAQFPCPECGEGTVRLFVEVMLFS